MELPRGAHIRCANGVAEPSGPIVKEQRKLQSQRPNGQVRLSGSGTALKKVYSRNLKRISKDLILIIIIIDIWPSQRTNTLI